MLELILLTFLLQLILGSAIVPALWGLIKLAGKLPKRARNTADHTRWASGLAMLRQTTTTIPELESGKNSGS